MGDEQSNVTAAVTIKVPQSVGWAIQRGAESWQGSDLSDLFERLGSAKPGTPVTLSLSLIFELTGSDTPLVSDDE